MRSERPVDSNRPAVPQLLIADDRSDEPHVRRITVAGEIDALGADQLYRTVTDVLRCRRPSLLEVNLRGVIFLDSAGVAALLRCRADAEREGCRLMLTDPHPRAFRVLQAAGLSRHVQK